MKRKFCYLNTDLDLVADRDLSPLVAALTERGLFALHVTLGEAGRWYVTFETYQNSVKPDEGPELTIAILLEAVESLSRRARKLWSEYSLKEFNIGYDCGDEPWAFNQGLSSKTLRRLGKVGASLRITLYPPAKRKRGSRGKT